MQARTNIFSSNFNSDGDNFNKGSELNTSSEHLRRADNSGSGSSNGVSIVFLPQEKNNNPWESSNGSYVDMGVESLSNTFLQLDLMRNARQELQEERTSRSQGGNIEHMIDFLNSMEDPRKCKGAFDYPDLHSLRTLDLMGKWLDDENQHYFQGQPLHLSQELELLWYKHIVSQLRSKVKVLLHEKFLLGKEVDRMNGLLSHQRFLEPLLENFPPRTSTASISIPKVEMPEDLDFNNMSPTAYWHSTTDSWTQPFYSGNSEQESSLQASVATPHVFKSALTQMQPVHDPYFHEDSMSFNHCLPALVGQGYFTQEAVSVLPQSLEEVVAASPKESSESDVDVCRFDLKTHLRDKARVGHAHHDSSDISSSSSTSNPDGSLGSLNTLQRLPTRQEKKLAASSSKGFSHAHQGQMKTELCKNWKAYGDCPYSTNCRFAHGVGELRPIIRHPLYKTQICRRLLEGKKCIYSHRCHFRHSLTQEEMALIARLRKW